MSTIVTRAGKGSPLTNTEVDSNFSNLNSDKVEKSGDTLTGDLAFGDNVKAKFGASDDLQIYHDGFNSIIDDAGTGNLIVQGANVEIRTRGGNKYFEGAANVARLYHTNNEKLRTFVSGVVITGTVTADSLTVEGTSTQIDLVETDVTDNNTRLRQTVGDFFIQTISDDKATIVSRLNLDHATGDISFYDDAGTSQDFYWDASTSRLGLGTTSPSAVLDVNGIARATNLEATASVKIEANNPQFHIVESDGPTDENFNMRVTGGNLQIRTANDALNTFTNRLQIDGGTGDLVIFADDGTSQDFYWDASTSRLGLGTTSPSSALHISNANQNTFSRGNLYIASNSDMAIDRGGQITFGGQYITDSSSETFFGSIAGRKENGTSGSTNGYLALATRTGSETPERMRIDSSGNVGIGTTSPNNAIHVQGANKGFRLSDTSGTTDFHEISSGGLNGQNLFIDADRNGNSGAMIFRVNGANERMRIDSSGNVGIGTTSPSAKLHIDRLGATIASNLNTSITNLIVSRANTVGILISGASDNACRLQFGDENDVEAGLIEYKHNLDSMLFYTNSSESMRIDSSGRLGIGTTSPDSLFHISSGGPKITITDTTYNADATITVNDAGALLFSADANNERFNSRIQFDVDGSEKVRIDQSGNVGIGTTSPTKLLEVDGDAKFVTTSGVGLQLHNDTSNQSYIQFTNTVTGETVSSGFQVGIDAAEEGLIWHYKGEPIKFATSNSERMRIDSSGNVGIGTTSPSEPLHISRTGGGLASVRIDNTTDDVRAAFFSSTGYFGINALNVANTSAKNIALATAGGNVGIGTTSPQASLHVVKSDAGFEVDLDNVVTNGVRVLAYDRNTSTDRNIQYRAAQHFFNIGSSEAARIDSSGNLLVGKTATSYNTEGVNLTAGGHVTRSGDTVFAFNRTSSDGSVVNFAKDGSTVGSIGVDNTDNIFLSGNSGHSGLMVSTDAILPYANGALTSASEDLGSASYRWRNLYLSGGVYLGGTGSANLLDDYEEGTWTPVAARFTGGAITATYSTQDGTYIKIGNLVYITCYLVIDSVTSQGSSYTTLNGLPFDSTGTQAYVNIMSVIANTLNTTDVMTRAYTGGTKLFFSQDKNGNFPPEAVDWKAGTMRISGCYYIT